MIKNKFIISADEKHNVSIYKNDTRRIIMANIENAEIRQVSQDEIWQDRKHHLWFPLSFTKYSVENGRIYTFYIASQILL